MHEQKQKYVQKFERKQICRKISLIHWRKKLSIHLRVRSRLAFKCFDMNITYGRKHRNRIGVCFIGLVIVWIRRKSRKHTKIYDNSWDEEKPQFGAMPDVIMTSLDWQTRIGIFSFRLWFVDRTVLDEAKPMQTRVTKKQSLCNAFTFTHKSSLSTGNHCSTCFIHFPCKQFVTVLTENKIVVYKTGANTHAIDRQLSV